VGYEDRNYFSIVFKKLEGVSPSVPMRSGVLGVFAIVLEFCGYAALAAYAYQKAPVYGAILFAGTTFACSVSSAYHLKCGLAEYMFLKYGRDERAKGMMLDLMGSGASLRLCSLGMITFYITLMVAIITGAIGFPIWRSCSRFSRFSSSCSPCKSSARCILPRWCQCLAGCS